MSGGSAIPGAVVGILVGGYCLRQFQLTRRGEKLVEGRHLCSAHSHRHCCRHRDLGLYYAVGPGFEPHCALATITAVAHHFKPSRLLWPFV